MLELDDYRKSRFYQEGVAEGVAEGEAKGKAESRAEVVHRMASKGYALKEIAEIVGVEIGAVEAMLKSRPS